MLLRSLIFSAWLTAVTVGYGSSWSAGARSRLAYTQSSVLHARAPSVAAVVMPHDVTDASTGMPRRPGVRRNRRGGVERRDEPRRAEWNAKAWQHAQLQHAQQRAHAPSPAEAPSMARAMRAAQRGDAAAAVTLTIGALAASQAAERLPSVRSCNQLLRELGDGSHVDEMMEVFQVMQLAGLQPTQVTYGTLISRAGSAREPVLAAQCFRDMLRRGLQPDVQTFNSLINAFAKVSSTPKRSQCACATAGACQTSVEQNSHWVLHTCVAWCAPWICSQAGDVNKAFTAADAMHKRGIKPTLVTFNTLIDACARGGNLTLAYETHAEMREANLRPNERTYSILIHACARQVRVEEAFGWLSKMRAGGLTPNAVTWSAIINACCKSRQIDRAFQMLSEMKGAGLTPNVITYTTLIDGCAKVRALKRLSVCVPMGSCGAPPLLLTPRGSPPAAGGAAAACARAVSSDEGGGHRPQPDHVPRAFPWLSEAGADAPNDGSYRHTSPVPTHDVMFTFMTASRRVR